MAREFLRLAETLPAGFDSGRVLYDIEALHHPDMDLPDMFWKYCDDGAGQPVLASGISICNDHRVVLYYSFDGSPFYSDYADEAGCSDVKLSENHISSFKTAACFYNECVEDIFDIGFIIVPTGFINYLDGIYPVEKSQPNVPVFKI